MDNIIFESYGSEWEKQMMKLSKKILIQMLKDALKKNEEKFRPPKNPFSNRMLYGLDVG